MWFWVTSAFKIFSLWLWLLPIREVQADDAPIHLFAAASLADVLQDALSDFPAHVSVSLGGSGAIARQITQGAPADVVVLANPAWMDWLAGRAEMRAGTRMPFAANTLVVVGPPDALPLERFKVPEVLERLGRDGRLAIGEHRAVPAGQYARAWLESIDAWEALRPHLAEVENVRAALALVTRGEVPMAIVYQSDLVAAGSQARAIWQVPPADQPRIVYELAALTERGEALATYLASDAIQPVLSGLGFSPVTR